MPRKINRRGHPPGQDAANGESGLLPGYLFEKVVNIPDQYLALGTTLPTELTIGDAGSTGISDRAAPFDHKHVVYHGNLLGGTLHALATYSTPGFMSAQDKIRLDTLWNSPSGGGGGGVYAALFVWHESPAGARDGANATFTLAYSPNPVDSLTLYRNGLLLRPGSPYDFLLSGNVITFNSPSIPITQDILRANYQLGGASPGGGGGGGVTDHGLLSGLADDDHLQYLTSPRANTWLATKTTSNLLEGSNQYFTNERAQDAVGGILTNSSSVTLTYNDGLNTITAAVIPGGVSHGSLAGLTTGDPHTQYQLRSEKNANSGYAGLTSGGLLSPSRIPVMPLSFLSDVSPGTPLNGYVLTYNASSGQWQSQSPTGGGGGVTDHGALTGLADDDHTQYLTSPRANTWLSTKTTTNLTEGTQLYYTDERAQDAFGAMVSPSATIKWSYNDAAGKIQASVSPAGISHSSLASLTSGDPHTQYQLRSEKNTANGYAGLDASGVLSPVRIPPLSLASLSDVSPSAPTNGQTLVYNAASGQWRNESPSAGALTLAGLTDVSPTTPTNNQVLAYHAASGQWRNQSPTTVDDIITCYIDASPDLIAVGKKAYKVIPYNCSVTGWYVVASSSGTIAWDIKKSTFASYPTTATIISGSSPKLTAQSKNSNISITGWSPLSAGDVIDFHISSNTDITNSGLFLKVRRTS